MDRITKYNYFILRTEGISAENIAYIYIKKVFIKYKVLKKIILD